MSFFIETSDVSNNVDCFEIDCTNNKLPPVLNIMHIVVDHFSGTTQFNFIGL